MHEWALAKGVISTALEVAEEKGATGIEKINIKIGSLQDVERDIFEYALGEISSGTLAEGSEMNIETVTAELECRVCGEEWEFDESKEELDEEETESIHFIPDLAHSYIRCPNCSSPDFKIEKGRGVWLDSVELRSDDSGS
ncbi:hypothetical protein AKJ52_02935 [candidate division MSBL1 archaeon SCGC-AAA382C18]|uniref:Hydrogenase maturation factor HypA n=1 Tax=candidate division MSBL1 archaeon SCGC-AAA382C18 TaxID=1698281 RepID=A0A133VHD0_9EURY|nr:hypothetical protein AKJ52_02935 [candidate division MSBL1 archaeon SCGC-AAA382C18]